MATDDGGAREREIDEVALEEAGLALMQMHGGPGTPMTATARIAVEAYLDALAPRAGGVASLQAQRRPLVHRHPTTRYGRSSCQSLRCRAPLHPPTHPPSVEPGADDD